MNPYKVLNSLGILFVGYMPAAWREPNLRTYGAYRIGFLIATKPARLWRLMDFVPFLSTKPAQLRCLQTILPCNITTLQLLNF